MTWIKICGTTNLDDALAAVEAGADALGFIFAPSPRRLDPRQAAEIVSALPPHAEKVGLFVNEPADRILDIVESVGLTAIQLQGEESPEFAASLRVPRVGHAPLRVFKALGVTLGFEAEFRAFATSGVDALLLDSVRQGGGPRGGTGIKFDWNHAQKVLSGVAGCVPVIVAGGLRPENVTEAIQRLSPWGVDVCTGVEREPGKKDPDKVRQFVSAVRAAEKRV